MRRLATPAVHGLATVIAQAFQAETAIVFAVRTQKNRTVSD
jgi:hypothetical protein